MNIVLLTVVVAVVGAVPIGIPEPGHLALMLNEDEFEDYLDAWLETNEAKYTFLSSSSTYSDSQDGCTFRVNGDLGQPQPVYLHNGNYVTPSGNSGQIHIKTGEEIVIACTGSNRVIRHSMITSRSLSTASARCAKDALVYGEGWLDDEVSLVELVCSGNSQHTAEYTSERCYNNNVVIRVGFIVHDEFYPLYWSCFDQNTLEVLYVWYEQNPPNAVHQTGVNRPSWSADSFFPSVAVNTAYTQAQQKNTIARLIGNEQANKYVTNQQFLARGHLAAKTDFIYATGQRATFYFINAAPQWQPFNGGNWNWLEQNLRVRIGEAGYNTTIYTGTFGISQLRDENNNLVDIFLHQDANNNPQIPVPLYYYKVVYDASLRLGTAFVGINNPYYTEDEVRALTFCTDRCRNNNAFNWLRWQPDRIDIGYSFCCTVDDFRRTVPHLPPFNVNGLLA